MKIAISSCLLGLPCRYDGKIVSVSLELQQFLASSHAEIVAFCPEFAAFHSSPRPPIRLVDLPDSAKEYHIEFHDKRAVTDALYTECTTSAEAVKQYNPDVVILKDGSPVCGSTKVDVKGVWKEGRGLFAQLLYEAGFVIKNEENFNED